MNKIHSGGCRCGAIKFEASSEPFYTSYCHCSDCRRATGAPLAAFVGFFAKDVTFSGVEPSKYGKHPVKRSFCANCGAPIAYSDARLSHQIFLMLGAMDHPERYAPAIHGYVSEQLPFLHLNDDLPRLETHTAPRPGDGE
jgi:hypothetical protein